MRMDRTANDDEVKGVLHACKDYQNKEWKVPCVYTEWRPREGNDKEESRSTSQTSSRH